MEVDEAIDEWTADPEIFRSPCQPHAAVIDIKDSTEEEEQSEESNPKKRKQPDKQKAHEEQKPKKAHEQEKNPKDAHQQEKNPKEPHQQEKNPKESHQAKPEKNPKEANQEKNPKEAHQQEKNPKDALQNKKGKKSHHEEKSLEARLNEEDGKHATTDAAQDFSHALQFWMCMLNLLLATCLSLNLGGAARFGSQAWEAYPARFGRCCCRSGSQHCKGQSG